MKCQLYGKSLIFVFVRLLRSLAVLSHLLAALGLEWGRVVRRDSHLDVVLSE